MEPEITVSTLFCYTPNIKYGYNRWYSRVSRYFKIISI